MTADSAPAATPALELRALSVTRSRRRVLDIDRLEVAPGETVAVLGPNGAGKSTLLLSAALLLPAEGEVRLFGDRVTRGNRIRLRRMTSTVFQDSALLDMPARRNVEQALAIHGVARAERRGRADRWLERLGIAARAEARPYQLSGGEAQRVSLARALAVEPKLLYLDEPFSGLDYTTRARLVGEMRTLMLETGLTALLTTHDHAEAAVLADRLVVLIDGRVAQSGPTAQVLRAPATEEVARFLGFAVVHGGPLGFGEGKLGIPSSAVAVVPADTPGARRACVRAVEGAAGGVRLALDAGQPLAADLAIEALTAARWAPGDTVHVCIDEARVVRL